MSSFATADNQQLGSSTHAKHQELFFVRRVIFIEEYELGFIKRDLMLVEVCNGFGLIPFEFNLRYIVFLTFPKPS